MRKICHLMALVNGDGGKLNSPGGPAGLLKTLWR